MLININKDLYVINEHIQDQKSISTKIVDSLPNDIEEYKYQYINGEFVRGNKYDDALVTVEEMQDMILDLQEQILRLQLGE